MAISNPYFLPAANIITAITNSNPATVTTQTDNQYISGLIVRLDVPFGYGMTQVNQLFGPITVLSSTQFTIPIDTSFFDPFVVPSGPPPAGTTGFQQAQSIPIGELSSMLTGAVRNILPFNP